MRKMIGSKSRTLFVPLSLFVKQSFFHVTLFYMATAPLLREPIIELILPMNYRKSSKFRKISAASLTAGFAGKFVKMKKMITGTNSLGNKMKVFLQQRLKRRF